MPAKMPETPPTQQPATRHRSTVILGIGVIVAMIVTWFGLVQPSSGPTVQPFDAYMAQDRDHRPIDCAGLVTDLTPTAHRLGSDMPVGTVAEMEQQHGYRFQACRSAIDTQLQDACQQQADNVLSGYDMSGPHLDLCRATVRTSVLAHAPTLSVDHGWALINGVRLQIAQIVSVTTTPVAGFDGQTNDPSYVTLTTSERQDNHHVYVLPDALTAQRWVEDLTHASTSITAGS